MPTDIDLSRIRIISIEDIEALETALYGTRMPSLEHEEIALGGRREVAKNIMAAFIDHDIEYLSRSRLNLETPMA